MLFRSSVESLPTPSVTGPMSGEIRSEKVAAGPVYSHSIWFWMHVSMDWTWVKENEAIVLVGAELAVVETVVRRSVVVEGVPEDEDEDVGETDQWGWSENKERVVKMGVGVRDRGGLAVVALMT